MNCLNLINPLSNNYHALEDFKKLTLDQKIITIVATALASIATLFIGTAAVFRLMVGHYVNVLHPAPVNNSENTGTPPPAPPGKNNRRLPLSSRSVIPHGPKPSTSLVKKKMPEAPSFPNPMNPSNKLEQVTKKTHQMVLFKESTHPLAKTVEEGLNLGLIERLDKFDVNQPIKLTLGKESVTAHIVGSTYKAQLPKENSSSFIYLINANVIQGNTSHAVKIAFSSTKDAQNPFEIGKLVLEQMNSNGKFLPGTGSVSALALPSSAPVQNKTETLESPNSSLSRRLNSIERQAVLLNFQKYILESQKEQQLIAKAIREENLSLSQLESGSDSNSSASSEDESSEVMPPRAVDDGFEIIDIDNSVIEKKKEKRNLGLEAKDCNLVSYLCHYLSELGEEKDNETKKIQDTDALAFKEGKIIKAENEEAAQTAFNEFSLIMKMTYGTILTKRVFGRYGLNNKTAITLRDLKKIMIGVAANVLEHDLKRLFNHIKNDAPGQLSSYKVGDFLYQRNPDLYRQIQAKNSFDELSAEEVNFLHNAFRTVPIQKSGFGITDVLSHLKKFASNEDYLFRHDLSALELLESWNRLDLNYPDLAIGEYTGKSLAYLELKQGLILQMPLVPKNGETASEIPRLYKVAKSLQDKNDAVVAHILAPLNDKQAVFSDSTAEKSEDIFLVFRGTFPESEAAAGGMSLYRDFHYAGIGRETYDKREKEIQDMTKEYLDSTSRENVTLRISGHSLGGCDTQRALVSLLEKIAQSEEGSSWRKVKNIVITTYNAPKPNQSVNVRMKKSVRKIHEKGINLNIDIKHVRFFDKSYEDTIEKFGDVLVGADYHGGAGEEVFKNAPNIKRSLIKLHMDDDQGLANGFLIRHGYRPFNKALCNIPYKMDVLSTDPTLSSDPEKDRVAMEKDMAGNYYWNKEEMTLIAQVVGNLGWYTSWILLREPKKVVQAVFVNALHSAGLTLARIWNASSDKERDLKRALSDKAVAGE